MIELRPSDLCIKTLEDGREVVQLKGGVAFDESFINEMRDSGVKEAIVRDNDEDEKDE